MGFFPRYDKEGPGVYADDPKHGPFVTFFQTYSNKFFKIVSINMMTVLFNLPAVILAYIGVIFVLPQINPLFAPAAFQTYLSEVGITAADSATTAN